VTRPLDLVFMGTPEFAATILAGLLASPHRMLAVCTQPPRQAGRGHRVQPSPVQALAERRGIPVRAPQSLRDAAAEGAFGALGADAAVVAAYGLILPPAILAAPRLGCLNVHASLLPRWRGAAPVQRAILAGDRETGITIMQMDEGLDTGAILLQQAVPIGGKTTAGELTAALAVLGAELVLAALEAAARGALRPHPQPDIGVTYARKLGRDEARLDWRGTADLLERQVRAFDPRPGAFFLLGEDRLRVRAAETEPHVGSDVPGTVLNERLSIACGDRALRPTRLQRPGRLAQDVADFLRGYPIPPGTLLPCPATA
jgi:methionyl-tRNA formyltransferase